MGGRGSKYETIINKHINSQDDLPQNDSTIAIDELKILLDTETEYHNEMYDKLKALKVSVRQSTDDLDDKILERQEKTVYNVVNKYNKIISYTTELQDLQLGADTIKSKRGDDVPIAYCLPMLKNGQITQRVVINKNYYKNYDDIVSTINYGIKNKRFVPIDQKFNTRDYTLTHEFGHAIENGLYQKTLKANNIFLEHNLQLKTYIENTAIKIKDEVKKICQQKYNNGKILTQDEIYLSEYSKKNAREWFAETFTNLELAEKPAPIALALGDYLKEKMK